MREQYWSLAPLGADLYDGLPGIALFLAYLGGSPRRALHAAGAHHLLHTATLSGRTCDATTIGGYSGWGGVINASPI
jgi:lantibiotic modifying enzyme